jgi:hypothetical protein
MSQIKGIEFRTSKFRLDGKMITIREGKTSIDTL